MNGVLNTGLEFWQIIVGIITLTLSVVTIKFAISFDINKFLERKDSKNDIKLKNACPHFMLEIIDENKKEIQVSSLFQKPFGTLNHRCKQCGLSIMLDMEQHERDMNRYFKDPQSLLNDQAKFVKLARKAGKISK